MVLLERCQFCASRRRRALRAANNAKQDCDHGDDQQHVDDAAGVVTKEADCPDDDQDDCDGVKEISHGVCFKSGLF